MKTALALLCLVAVGLRVVGGEVLSGLDDCTAVPAGYVPPILSNGELSLALDETCGMSPTNTLTGVYLAGRRHNAPWWKLFCFAKLNSFVMLDGRKVPRAEMWSQHLDVHRGRQTFRHRYAHALTVETEAFVMYARNAVVFRRRVTNAGDSSCRIGLGLSVNVPSDKFLQGGWKVLGKADRQRAVFAYGCLEDWPFESTGNEYLYARAEKGTCTSAATNREASVVAQLTLSPGESRSADFVFAIDNWGGIVPWAKRCRPSAAETLDQAMKDGFDGLAREHEKGWADYWSQGFVRLPDARLQRMMDVANYHVRCDRTPWSFPVGVFPSHWNGRYFGFDEMYVHQGMISAGHIEDARRCPDFRFQTLPDAEKRVGHYGRHGGLEGAQWMWESIELGSVEGCPVGFWQQHYFHMATICRTAWTQYLYSDDRDWLREKGYPVMTGCARFFARNLVYRNPDGSVYLGKCTDLERLGSARERAYMTTVGAIYTMRSFADASDLLATNRQEAVEMRRTAEGLLSSLPTANGRFIGYPGCKEETVATMAGGFPFPVFGRHDKMHADTCRHFIAKGTRSSGNMYPTGSHVCPWYAGKMALSMIGLADDVEPYRWLKDAIGTIGLFGELSEINEPGLQMHPWFTTASGTILFAVNQMLLCNTEGELWLAMATPKEWHDFAFRLPAYGGLMVSAEVKNDRLVHLKIDPRSQTADTRLVKLRIRNRFLNGVSLTSPAILSRQTTDGETLLCLRVAGSVRLDVGLRKD